MGTRVADLILPVFSGRNGAGLGLPLPALFCLTCLGSSRELVFVLG